MSKAKGPTQPSKDAFNEWRGSPVAEWFFHELQIAAEAAKEDWVNRTFNASGPHIDVVNLAGLKAYHGAFAYVCGLEFDDIAEGVENDL